MTADEFNVHEVRGLGIGSQSDNKGYVIFVKDGAEKDCRNESG